MGWWRRMFKTKVTEQHVSPQDIALNATLADLRRVASELQETNRAFADRVEVLKERPRGKSPGVPERRKASGSMVAMDAALLAHQTSRLDALNDSIHELATAVQSRPTRTEIDNQAKRNRLKAIASALLVVTFGLVLFFQQQAINSSQKRFERVAAEVCEDRNGNNRALVALLGRISEIQTKNTDAFGDKDRKMYVDAFAVYTKTLTPIDCSKYVTN